MGWFVGGWPHKMRRVLVPERAEQTVKDFKADKKNFDDAFRASEEFDVWTFFVRALIGFTEYGRPF